MAWQGIEAPKQTIEFPAAPSFFSSKKWIKLIPKTIGNRKRDCAWGWAREINTTWENLQIEKHKSVRWAERTPSWFCAFRSGDFLNQTLFVGAEGEENFYLIFNLTFLVVRNADHWLRLPAIGIIMVKDLNQAEKRSWSTETSRRQMHKDGTARSLLAAVLIRCLDGAILPW